MKFAKKFATLSLLLALTTTANAALNQDWIKQSSQPDSDYNTGVSTDNSGNSYVTGNYNDRTTRGNPDAVENYIYKYNANGNLQWARKVNTLGDDISTGISTDSSGNSYITGFSDGYNANHGRTRTFLSKIDTYGYTTWTRQLSSRGSDISTDVSIDNNGNSYITGYTDGDLDGTNAGGYDAFIAKYNTHGNLAWTKQLGTSGNDVSNDIATDNSGNSYITGNTDDTNTGRRNAFIAKYDTNGNFAWKKQLDSARGSSSKGIATDNSGNSYITGYINDGTNPGDHVSAFIAKYDTNGDLAWTKQLGSSSTDNSNGVSIDNSGNIYITGYTFGDLDGTNAGDADAFISLFNTDGDLLWTEQFGSSSSDFARSISADSLGNIFVAGYTDSNSGDPNWGDRDAFLVKFTVPEPTSLALLTLPLLALTKRNRKTK